MARQQHSPEEKSKLVLEAIRGERTINEIVAENNIHPNMLSKWKRELNCTHCSRTTHQKNVRIKKHMKLRSTIYTLRLANLPLRTSG